MRLIILFRGKYYFSAGWNNYSLNHSVFSRQELENVENCQFKFMMEVKLFTIFFNFSNAFQLKTPIFVLKFMQNNLNIHP